MEVNNRSVMSPSFTIKESTTAPSILVGDVNAVVIKGKNDQNEAKVVMKGQELTVTFDGPMPTEDRAIVEVTRQNENGQLTVKLLSNSKTTAGTQTVEDLLKKSGFDPAANPDLKEGAKQIIASGGSVSKDSLQNIQDFLKNDTGSITDKLTTIKVMQQKNIEFTAVQLNAVNTALHGEALTDTLQNLLDGPIELSQSPSLGSDKTKSESTLEQAISQLKTGRGQGDLLDRVMAVLDPVKDASAIASIKKALQIQQAGKDRIIQSLQDPALKAAVEQASNLTKIIDLLKTQELSPKMVPTIQDAIKLEKIGAARLDQVLSDLLDEKETAEPSPRLPQIQKESSMEKVLQSVQRLVDGDSHQEFDLSGLRSAYEKATQLAGQGRELAARKELASAISALQERYPQLHKSAEDTSLSKGEQYAINEAVQTLELSSKNILVTEITKKLSQLAIDFKQMRREVSRNLDSASRLIDTNKQANSGYAKQMLDTSISKLDNAILKGDYMLYTDMATEKKLLSASSRLAEARTLLTKGNYPEANQIVKEVKGLVDQLNFKPADNRVKHFISQQDLLDPKSMLEKAVRPFPDQERGARSIFETVKGLGLTHEMDAAKALVEKQEATPNLKSILLQLLEANDGQPKAAAEHALASITGQQLVNKQDSTGMQNLFMQLPLLLNKQVENVKVFVNSQKKGEKIDWENCSLYFVLETKKLGEVGISISAVNRNLSITFKNDQASLQQDLEPLTTSAKENLQEIGYSVGAIQFKPLATGAEIATTTNSNDAEKPAAAYPATFTEKGYDFTI